MRTRKPKPHIAHILTLNLVWLILSVDGAAASDWFVRPAGGDYESEDGSSYQDAWDGLSNVVWGPGGVEAGDNLYVCGLHLRTREGGAAYETFIPDVNGTEGNVITIRGDYPGDPGIIWGAGIMAHEAWADEGDNTWSITEHSTPYNMWFFEDVTSSSWTVLSVVDAEGTITGTWTFTNGSVAVEALGDDGNALNEVAVGDFIRLSDFSTWYKVQAVPDKDTITLTANFTGTTHTDDLNETVINDISANITECKATPGSVYSSSGWTGTGKLFVHCTDNAVPTNRVAANRLGYFMQMNDLHYITWLNLKFYCIYSWLDYTAPYDFVTNMTWDGCTIWYGETLIIKFMDDSSDITFTGCDIAWAKNGIGMSESDSPWPSGPEGDDGEPNNITISNCVIHDIGNTFGDTDAHAIGANGCSNILIEDNEMYNVGTGVTFYCYDVNQAIKNVTVRRNWVHDTHTNGGATSRGVDFNTGPGQAAGTSAVVYSNVVGPNIRSWGYKYSWEEMGEFYNNVAYDCGISFFFVSLYPINATLRNNISLHPKDYHIRFGNYDTCDVTSLNSDYNIFYPVTSDDFFIYVPEEMITDIDFSEWQALSIPGYTFDTHSIVADPLFVDPENGNFHLWSDSPAINAGVDVGLTQDFDGNPVPQGSGWDIGAYEYILSAITDLSVSGTSQNSVTFVWTVPGEEGYTGKPARYDIRYADSPITETNWDSATQVQGEPVPGDFGDEQSFTVTGLNPDTTYYIAIKTSNDTGSTTSPLSNVISGSTDTSGNHAPVLELIGDQSLIENEPFTLVISATDADAGDTLTYSATNIPTGADFGPATRTFTWTPTSSQSGTYQVTFQVTDDQVTVSETITITVTGIQSTLTISSNSGGSTIPVEGPHSYDEGTVVSIEATAVDNYHFVNWTGTAVDAGKVANPNVASTTVTADADYTIQANFAIDQHTLIISSTSGGTVTTPGEGTYPYDHGTAASVVAAPEVSYFFVNWTGTAVVAGQVDDPDSVSTTVTMDADCTIQANFGESDGIAPTVTNRLPDANDIQVPLNNLIILHVTDAGIGVKTSSVIIRLDGDTIYTGGDTYYDSATGTCRRIGTIADYTYAYQSSQTFDFDESKTVTVNATDLGGIAMTEESYSFRTEMRSFGQNKQVDSTVEGLDKAAPSTARDSSGNIWAVWHAGPTDSRDIYVGKLSVNEEYFGGINKIRGSTSDQCNPVIAIGSDNKLYVAWQDNRQADDNNQGEWDIYISTSVDGISWSTETRVNDPNQDNQVNPAIVIDGQSPNQAHVAWQDDRAGNQDICIATSSDSFATKTVSQITYDTFDQVEPAVAADSANTIYVVWTDGRNGSNDIYGAASNNPWTNVPIVSNTNNQSSPAVAAESEGSILHLLWVDDRTVDGDDDIFYDKTIGGLSPLTGSSIIDDTSGADQLDPTIAVTGSTDNNLKVFACWQDWRNTDTDLYFAELSAGTGTNVFVGDSGSNADQGEPAIGIGEYDHPYIIWADNRSTNTDIYYAGSTFVEPVALASELVTASAFSSTTVGTDPQAITTIDDVSIVVPAGACSYDVTITVSKIANLPAFAAPYLGGYDFGPSGIQFSQPVTITIPYAFSGSDSSATPYWFNSLTGMLSQQGITDIRDITISSSLHALSFKTTHFTAFFLFAGGGATVAIVGGGGGGGGCSVSTSGEGNIVEFMLPYIVLAVVMTILKMRDTRGRKARNMTAGKC